MFTIKKLKKSPNPTKRIKAGTYHATVTAVFDDEKYVAGDAFVLMYTLQCPDGTDAGEFRETFFNLKANTRTKELVALVEKLGINDVDDLIGLRFEVEIRYRVTSHGASLPSIISRIPISPPTADASPEEVK